MAVAGIAALLVAAGAFVYWSGDDRQPGAASPANAPPFVSGSLNRFTTTGTTGVAAISDDGRYVAYVITEPGDRGCGYGRSPPPATWPSSLLMFDSMG